MRFCLTLLFFTLLLACKKKEYDVIIRHANVYDGKGSAPILTDVAIQTDTIAFMGDLSDAIGKTEVEAKGLALSPGFIDTHSHHDRELFSLRDMVACTSQGITTIVVGQDGFSHFPLSDFFQLIEQTPASINIASYSGHNTLRDSVIEGNFQRVCTAEEVEKMKAMLRLDLEAGALGLSTGLEYDPGIFSSQEEVLELARVSAQFNGRYISHIRSEDRYFWKALNEIIQIGRDTKMPVQISHTKLAMKSIWGQSQKLLDKLDSARQAGIKITADLYPYAYWQSTMTVLFPERNFKDLKAATFALTELTTPEGMLIGNFTPDTTYVGKTLAEISSLRKTSPPKTLMDLIAEVENSGGDESIIATSMEEQDIKDIMRWPYTNICSDGSGVGRHPRGYGAFTKILRQYVREENVLSLQEAIRKMSSLAAENLGIPKRGRIEPGYYADLILFDPLMVADRATPEKPQLNSIGIKTVWVNGVEVFSGETATSKYPGKVIRKAIK